MSIISPHTHHYQNSVPSMEHDDSCSDTDTVLYTPTSSTTTMYYHPTWNSEPSFEDTINPLSKRPLSSPALITKKQSRQAIDAIDTQLSCVRPISLPPDDSFHPSDSPISPYETAIRRMSQHIDDFFNSRQEKDNVPLKKSTTDPVGAMIHLVHQFRDTTDSDQKLCDTMLAWLLQQQTITEENHDQEQPGHETKNARLITSITRLAHQHHHTKQAHKKEMSRNRRQEKQWIDRFEKEKQARIEAEEILDSVRIEMETMMEELDTAKQQLYSSQQEAQTIRDQWQDIIIHKSNSAETHQGDEVDPWALLALQQADWEQRLEENRAALKKYKSRSQDELSKKTHEIESLEQRLLKTKRLAAETDLKLVVLKSQKEKEKTEMIEALQRELVEKEKQLVLMNKKWSAETKRWDQQRSALMQSTMMDHQAWKTEYKEQIQKQYDLEYLKITRETRALQAQVLDLEIENERLMNNVNEHVHTWARLDQKFNGQQKIWTEHQARWELGEKESKALVLALEQKVIGLEAEAVRLYGKNIILANQLGECDA